MPILLDSIIMNGTAAKAVSSRSRARTQSALFPNHDPKKSSPRKMAMVLKYHAVIKPIAEIMK
jgi:hypothetical protein